MTINYDTMKGLNKNVYSFISTFFWQVFSSKIPAYISHDAVLLNVSKSSYCSNHQFVFELPPSVCWVLFCLQAFILNPRANRKHFVPRISA